jgi:ABC-type branched-subunit amino acid transport system substrate-binding protein
VAMNEGDKPVPIREQIDPVPAHRSSRTRPRRLVAGIVAVAAVLSLVAGACGDGRDESGDDGGGGGGSDTTVATGADGFGEMASPCGEGEGTNAAGTDPGLTADSITIAYGDDAGYQAAPGLNKEMSDAIKAMIDWCNDQGGINGREIQGNYYDAAILNVNNAMTDACQGNNFFLVGQGWSLDASQETVRLGCDLPSVPTYTVSPQFAHGKLMYQPTPNPVDEMSIPAAFQMAEAFPEEVTKAALMYANYSATIDSTEKWELASAQAGWTYLECDQQYAIGGESDWKPFVQRLKDCGAEIVYFSGSPYPNFENVLDAAAQIDYKPKWITEANFYDQKFADWNVSGNADNVYVRMAYFPFEQADVVPAVQQYLDLLEASNGGTSLLGMQATAAFLLWAQATQECGADLSRQCVLDKLSVVSEYTAGGLQAPANVGENIPSTCGMTLKMNGSLYEQVFPETVGEMGCSDEYLVSIAGPVVDRAQLDANRVSQAAG